MIKELVKHRKLIFELSKNDFKAKYATSFLGTVWALVLPLTTILVFWYVFQMGLKNSDINEFPFIVWYVPAFLSWNYFAEALSGATNSIREYSYLIKKVNFPVTIIPVVKIVSSLFVHIFFLLIIILINMVYGIMPSIYYVQVFYYMTCVTLFLLGLGWLFSSLSVIVPDMANVVNVILQIGFWVTPIIWNPENMSERIQNIMKINPMYYICQGYRETFIYQKWLWKNIEGLVLFWGVVLFIWFLGGYVYMKTKDRFADLL